MKFSAAQAKDARRPLAVQEVPPRVWAQTWLERPLEVVIVGFRSLAETTLSEITGAAQTHANRIVPAGEGSALWADEYSAAVRFLSLGRAMTQPDCADAPWWDYADLLAPQAFSPEGALRAIVPVPGDPMVTNVCFGGADMRTAWITASTIAVSATIQYESSTP